jgi:hypothetical protein
MLEYTGLSKNHPLSMFAMHPESPQHVLNLDDTVIWGTLSLLEFSKHKGISEAAVRLRDRHLFKCCDIRLELAPAFGENDKDRVKIDEACASIEEKIKERNAEWRRSDSEGLTRILVDKAQRAPYRKFDDSKGPLNQIRIVAEDGTVKDLGLVSDVVGAIRPFKLFRAYHAPSDEEARKFIIDIVHGEIKNAS